MTESQHDAADALIRTTKRIRACATTIQERVHHAFTEHPHAQRMTYCEHFKRAAWTALRMAGGAAALVVHSVFPFVFQTTGSDTVRALHGELKEAAGLDEPLDQDELDEPLDQDELDEPLDQEELDEPLDQDELDEPLDQDELDEPLDQDELDEQDESSKKSN